MNTTNNNMRRPVGLTDYQLAELQRAALALPPAERSDFLEGVARHLGNAPSDEALQAAIDMQLRTNRLPVFLCDSVPSKEVPNGQIRRRQR
jgi:hypothetical protein